jgi:lipoprotein-releasing system ATP-binding protein
MNSPALELKHVVRHYHQGERVLEVLKDVTLAIDPGELVALTGPSGSGKSTLLQIAGLLDTPQGGEILISGQEAGVASDRLRTSLRNRHIGFIYQFHHLLPELTAEENIMLPQQIAGVPAAEARERARTLLARLGLEPRADHLPGQLSGGEQQRVAIGRALANKPALILADEPTGNLDPETSDRVRDLLLQIAHEEKVAALIATHNMALAQKLHRSVTLKNGMLVPVGSRPV